MKKVMNQIFALATVMTLLTIVMPVKVDAATYDQANQQTVMAYLTCDFPNKTNQ